MDDSTQSQFQHTIQAYIDFFNAIEPGLKQGKLEQLTDPELRFVDPFNDVTGHEDVKKVLHHFIQNVEAPHFEVTHISWSEHICFLRWDFSGQLAGGKVWSFPGVSEIHLNDSAKITLHQDHWDAGQHFYQQLPVVGALLRWIRKRLQP